jgi:hypothetical protein
LFENCVMLASITYLIFSQIGAIPYYPNIEYKQTVPHHQTLSEISEI